jgi:hypothetical protein
MVKLVVESHPLCLASGGLSPCLGVELEDVFPLHLQELTGALLDRRLLSGDVDYALHSWHVVLNEATNMVCSSSAGGLKSAHTASSSASRLASLLVLIVEVVAKEAFVV